jgi:hypothetical protein
MKGAVMEKIKTNTVTSMWRQSKSRSLHGKDKVVPSIYMSGLWLEKFGFEIGQKFEIYSPCNNQLLLKAVSGYGKNSSKK